MAHRINHQSAFLLTSKPWRENSLWVEVFSRDYGRVALLARSARTRGSELRGVLIPFVPISVSWFGKEELKTLHRTEWLGGWAQPQNRALFSALYVNELVLKLTAREDPHPELYDAMMQVMQNICCAEQHIVALRLFEWRLLNILGFAPDFAHDEQGNDVQAELCYCVQAESPVRIIRQPEIPETSGVVVLGAILLALHHGTLSSCDDLQAASRVMRFLIDFRLPEMKTRQVLQQLNQLKKYGNEFSGCLKRGINAVLVNPNKWQIKLKKHQTIVYY